MDCRGFAGVLADLRNLVNAFNLFAAHFRPDFYPSLMEYVDRALAEGGHHIEDCLTVGLNLLLLLLLLRIFLTGGLGFSMKPQ